MRLILVALLVAGCSEPPQPVVTAADMCRNELTQWVKFKDPASVRVEGLRPFRTYAAGVDGHKVGPAQSYELLVNAKNGYGGYIGAQPYECVVADGKIITFGAM